MSDIYSDLLDSNLTEKEVQEKLVAHTVQEWMTGTAEGRTFAALYNTPQHRQKLEQVFNLLDESISIETLSAPFRKLRDSGAIRTEPEIREAAERAEQERAETNRARWELQCQSWLESHLTREISERAKTDRAFASYLKAANRLPQLPLEYSAENLARQRKAQKIQKERDRQDATVPEEVRAFAKRYQKMPFSQVQREMRDPQFRKQIDEAARAGLI